MTYPLPPTSYRTQGIWDFSRFRLSIKSWEVDLPRHLLSPFLVDIFRNYTITSLQQRTVKTGKYTDKQSTLILLTYWLPSTCTLCGINVTDTDQTCLESTVSLNHKPTSKIFGDMFIWSPQIWSVINKNRSQFETLHVKWTQTEIIQNFGF